MLCLCLEMEVNKKSFNFVDDKVFPQNTHKYSIVANTIFQQCKCGTS